MSKRLASLTLPGAAAVCLLVSAYAWGADSASGGPTSNGSAVQVRGRTAFTFQVPRAGVSPAERAARASKALQASIDENDQGDVEFVIAGEEATFRLGSRVLFVLTTADATAEGESSLYRHSERRRDAINSFLKAERRRATLQHTVLSLCLTVFLGFVSFLLLRQFSRWASRLCDWVESSDEHGVSDALRWVVGDERTRWVAVVAIRCLQLLGQALVVYLFLIGAFSLFEVTRPWREQLTAWVAGPIGTIGDRIAGSLPTLLILVLVMVVVQAGWHAINVTSDRIKAGRATSAGITPELMAPTKLLLRAGLVLASLLLLVPLITGDSEHLFTRAGYLMLQIVAVALLPLVATVAVGVWSMINRVYRADEWLVLWNGVRAQVYEVDFFYLRVAPEDGGELRIPHLITLVKPLRRLAGPAPLEVEIPAPASLRPAVADTRLRAAAEAFAQVHGLTHPPQVSLARLERDGSLFKVVLPGASLSLRGALLLALAAAVEPGAPEGERSA